MPVKARSVITVEPGTSTNKHTANKVLRPIIAIRGTSVGIIAVVTIRADRSRPNPSENGAHSNAHSHLSMRASCGKKQNPHESNIF
jgi:hypothetical protein